MSRLIRNTIIASLVLAGLAFLLLVVLNIPIIRPVVTNFDECVKAGYTVLNTLPRQCIIAEGKPIVESISTDCSAISFAQYAVPEDTLKGAPAPVDFNTYPSASEYKEVLVSGAMKGPNFAGRYTVVSSGCGKDCDAIVDAKTGRIILFGISSSFGIQYKKDSSLIVVNPPSQIPKNVSAEDVMGITTNYFNFENASLLPLCESDIRLP